MTAPEADGPHMRGCSRCRRIFKSRAGADAHIRTVHKGRGHRVSARRSDRFPDEEPSLAEEVVAAHEARACGEKVDPTVAAMFDI